MTDSNEIIQDAFQKLPKIVQDVLTSADLSEKLQAMAKKHNLHLDKWSLLENEIALALLGITDPLDLTQNIQSHVGVDEETAAKIANNAVEIVFDPIRADLEKAVAENRANEGINVPAEQKQALESIGEAVPKTVTQSEPQTVEGIIKSRMQQAATIKSTDVEITTFKNTPQNTQSVADMPLPDDSIASTQPAAPSAASPAPVKESIPKNTAANSSHMRKSIEGDPYREQP
jgi:hypothetical protein